MFCVTTFVSVGCEGLEVPACCACGWDFSEADELHAVADTTDDCDAVWLLAGIRRGLITLTAEPWLFRKSFCQF